MSSSKILFFLCVSFVLGIFLESLIKIPQIFVWGFLLLGILAIFISFTALSSPRKRGSRTWIPFFKGMTWSVAGFCVLFLVLGILRMQISEFNIANDKLSKFNGKGTVIFEGIISAEPDVRSNSQKLKVEAHSAGSGQTGNSVILVTTNRYPEYNYLDKIKLTGKLETPDPGGTPTDTFNYQNYLMKDGIYSVMGFPKIESLGKVRGGSTSTIYSWVLAVKQKMRKSIEMIYSPPESLILEGTLLGDNSAMTQDLKSKLNITGLRHIIAVSGTHIVILSVILMPLLLFFVPSRKLAIILSIAIVWLYIILTGLAASGVRAGIMGSLLCLSQILGRQNTGTRVLAIAASAMLLQNPLLLVYDVGFQLSFLAAMGIIYLNPLFGRLFKNLFKDKFKELSEIVSTTFSAQVFTMPLMMFDFGNISLVSPFTNLLILPIVSPLMIFGFISVFLGIFYKFLGFILSLPCQILSMYFIKVIDLFSQPWMAKSIKNVSWIWILFLYLIIFFATYFLNKKYSQKSV